MGFCRLCNKPRAAPRMLSTKASVVRNTLSVHARTISAAISGVASHVAPIPLAQWTNCSMTSGVWRVACGVWRVACGAWIRLQLEFSTLDFVSHLQPLMKAMQSAVSSLSRLLRNKFELPARPPLRIAC
jgi:hypothetical protein